MATRHSSLFTFLTRDKRGRCSLLLGLPISLSFSLISRISEDNFNGGYQKTLTRISSKGPLRAIDH
ncbi:hypothetical protein V6Z12_A09G108800 [Gossypium hirsutum]